MDNATRAKLDASTYPRKAVWMAEGGKTYSGVLVSRGPDYFEGRTEAGEPVRVADDDVMQLSFIDPNSFS